MSRENLVPEIRTDKNGVQSTRWVRAEDRASNSPLAAKLSPLAQRIAEVQQIKPWRLPISPQRAEEKLRRVCPKRSRQLDTHKGSFCEALKITDPISAQILADGGFSTVDKALDLVEKNNLGILAYDNSDMAAKMAASSLTTHQFMVLYRSLSEEEKSSPHIVDAASINQLRGSSKHLIKDVLKGNTSYSDISSYGGAREVSAWGENSLLYAAFRNKDKRGAFPDKEDFKLIMKASDRSVESNGVNFRDLSRDSYADYGEAALELAQEIGVEHLESFRQVTDTRDFLALELNGLPVEEKIRCCLYRESIVSTEGMKRIKHSDMAMLAKEDIPIEKVKQSTDAGLSIESIVGAHKEGIEPSVSTGWL